jgi:hypothetical protein
MRLRKIYDLGYGLINVLPNNIEAFDAITATLLMLDIICNEFNNVDKEKSGPLIEKLKEFKNISSSFLDYLLEDYNKAVIEERKLTNDAKIIP